MNYEIYTVDDFLLDDRFLAYCTGSDQLAVAFWEQWQEDEPANIHAFYEAERLCRILTANKPRLDHSLLELESLIQRQTQPAIIRPLSSRTSTKQWWLAAAAVILLSVVGLVGYQWWDNQYVIYETAYNQQRTVQLPDGSSVVLNSHSALRYQRSAFSENERQVELQGEGYFRIRHLTTHAPFRVKTNGAFDVKVLGTEFSVYNRHRLHRVVLNSGKVEVQFHDKQTPVTLRPGQMIEVGTSRSSLRPQTVTSGQYTAWMRHQLVFNQTRLAEVVQIVEEQFGVSVQLEGADPDLTFTGILPSDRPETVLQAVAELNQLTLRKTKDGYVLSKK